jgi:LPXTG-motif cell wall-anchored protein
MIHALTSFPAPAAAVGVDVDITPLPTLPPTPLPTPTLDPTTTPPVLGPGISGLASTGMEPAWLLVGVAVLLLAVGAALILRRGRAARGERH